MKETSLTQTATTANGNLKTKCTVTVKKPAKTMTLTTAITGEVDIWLAGTGNAIIDWGDGSEPETVTLSEYVWCFNCSHRYTHIFSGTTTRTIVIDGQNIRHLSCNGLQLTNIDVTNNTELVCLWGGINWLTNIDVTKNAALKVLECYDNRLTGIYMTKNNELERLECNDNHLTADGLNTLFGTLHANTDNNTAYSLYIGNNPGTDGCDHCLAIQNGWTVNTTTTTL